MRTAQCWIACGATDVSMTRVVVLGFGNPLRRDDGVGGRIAEALADRWSAKIVVRLGQQLVPEWAADLAVADVAFLVDASHIARRRLRLERLQTMRRPGLVDGHSLEPEDLLRLVATAYGHQPEAYLLHVPAEDFALG